MRRPIIAVLAAAAVWLGVVGLGHYGREWLDERHHYTIRFADLHCEAPPGIDKAKFLSEVQYCGGLPDTINILDAGQVNRLQAAFALHPWVEHVDGINLR